MSESIAVHQLRKGDQFEFLDGGLPPGTHTVLVSWGVTGRNGPVHPWMVATKDAKGRIHNLQLEPAVLVVLHQRRPDWPTRGNL
jgi:hypothetical protein